MTSDTEDPESIVQLPLRGGKGNATASTNDLFSMFYLPFSPSYSEGAALATSSNYTAPSLQGAASAVMGGIMSVLDTALAVLNEEFDSQADGVDSECNEGNENGLEPVVQDTERSTSPGCVMGCCRQSTRSKLSPSTSNTARHSIDDDEAYRPNHSAKHDNDAQSNGVEQSSSNDAYTPQNSLIGSISTLQLYDDSECSKSMIDMAIKQNSGIVCKGNVATPQPKSIRDEEAEYCIIRNERETKDGWLVISDD